MAIGLNSPRISAGALGFTSHMSRWLGPPSRKIKMHESAVGESPGWLATRAFEVLLRAIVAVRSSARNNVARFNPSNALPPSCSISRRDVLSGPPQVILEILAKACSKAPASERRARVGREC